MSDERWKQEAEEHEAAVAQALAEVKEKCGDDTYSVIAATLGLNGSTSRSHGDTDEY